MTPFTFKTAKKLVYICFAILMFQTSLLAQTAFAEDACDDLWYSRNFYFDQAGYCFGSKLGKAIFDNSNCKSKNISLTKSIEHRINQIKKMETSLQCKINVDEVRELKISRVDLRQNLITQPISQGVESSCFGFTDKKPSPLYSTLSENSKITGYIKLGDNVIAAHEQVPDSDWWFASVTDQAGNATLGWTKIIIFDHCEAMAG